MKICFYCDSVFSVGGVQRVLSVIAKGLSANHEVTILTSDRPECEDRSMYGLDETNIRFRYICYPSLPFYEYFPSKTYSLLYKKVLPKNKLTTRGYVYSSFPPTYRKLLIGALSAEAYDVIVGVHVYPSFYLSAVRKHLKAKIVGWLHTSFDAFFCHPGIWLWRSEQRFRYQMKQLDRIVVLTHYDRDLYAREMGLSCDVIYNPLTLEPQGMGSPEYKKFLSVGRMTYLTKGFDILIDAFAIFARQNPDWTLDIVGEGPEREKLQDAIEHYGLTERVRIYPFTTEIQRYYAHSSVFIMSSRWEGFSLVMVEAMSHGLPVLASDLPVVQELLGQAGNTVVFRSEQVEDLAQKMLILSQSAELQAMGNESVRVVQKFQLSAILQQWDELLAGMFSAAMADGKNNTFRTPGMSH